MSSAVAPVLPQGAGYGVVVGIGLFFALLMAFVSYLQNRYTQYSTKASEEFNTASRSVKPGLIANGVVSAWTWAATLLQSSTVAYQYGISGPFWCESIPMEHNAPYCHTFLEIVYHRYGKTTHMVFIFFALMTNTLVASQLLLGGSAVVTALTGMNVYAAVFLIPLGVCIYVVLGGLRATFLCDYSHTIIVMLIILYFMFDVYTTNDSIGSPSRMYDLLQAASLERPVDGNTNGSYLTLKSNYGLIFGVIQLCSGLGTVFLDQGYWQRAIASRPTTAVRAYIMGGLSWFAIPFGFATTLGLAAVALTDHPSFPTYPNNMTSSQISAGLAAPFGATALAGKNGATALLLTLFMAVTSSASSQLIAVSSLLTFDVYKTYIRPKAHPQELIFVSHLMICAFGVVMACVACLWNGIGIDLGWLFLVMGLLIGGAVFPAAFAILWKGQTRVGAISGAIGGLVAGLVAWLVEAKVYYGELTVKTTGAEYPTLAGNMASVLTGLILTVTISYLKPDDFNWEKTRAINAPDTARIVPTEDPKAPTIETAPSDEGNNITADATVSEDPKSLQKTFVMAVIVSTVLSTIMDIIIPIPMFLTHYVFSRPFFTAWVVISFLWVFVAFFLCGVLPIVETRKFWAAVLKRIFSEKVILNAEQGQGQASDEDAEPVMVVSKA
ncbi:sodium:solute symporter family protein [Aspergillus lucknowensis]|uniref:Sodium:solute symporter family-domain-containing protein n=1 Tax=Aspergillus lucknowensis TaxID=176173 RepID=A0ABR4LHT4_9EURO